MKKLKLRLKKKVKLLRLIKSIKKDITEDILDRYDNSEYWDDRENSRKAKKQNILDRYDNSEYWDEDLVQELYKYERQLKELYHPNWLDEKN